MARLLYTEKKDKTVDYSVHISVDISDRHENPGNPCATGGSVSPGGVRVPSGTVLSRARISAARRVRTTGLLHPLAATATGGTP